MWVCPSRCRPDRLDVLIRACLDTGMTTPCWVRIDEDDPRLPEYLALALPRSWTRGIGPRLSLSAVYNEIYRSAPGQPWWGVLADDVVPLTPGWDRILIETAGTDGMAVPAGGETTGGTPHFVLAAALPRRTGWLALPGLGRLYIDTVWADLARAAGVLRFRPDVVLSHRHFSSGGAPFDSTYRKPDKAADRALYDAWTTERTPT